MNDQDTWIDPPVYQAQPPEEPPLPPMPPPPPPPGGGGRGWLVLGVVMGLVIVALCLVAGYVLWQNFAGDGFDLGGGQEEVESDVFQTQTALADEIQDAVLVTDTPSPEPTADISPTSPPPADTQPATEPPTETTAPTPAGPIFTASQAIFCRTGPSSIYPEVRTMAGGMSLPILGQSTSPVDGVSIWWEVEIEGRRCFVSSAFGTVEGDTSGVPVLQAPPTPTPTPTQTPTATPTATATP